MATKEEYEKAVKNIKDAFYAKSVNLALATENFKTNLDFLAGLINERFEEKAETNAEHYLNDLLKIGRHFCFMHGKVKDCCDVGCDFCTFGKANCDKERFKWLASPHKKPTHKLSQFEYDLISTYDGCHEACKFSDCRQLRGLKEKGYFKSVDANTPVHEILDNCEVIK